MSLQDEELTAAANRIASRKRCPLGLSRNEWRDIQAMARAVVDRGLKPAAWDDVEATLAAAPGIVKATFPETHHPHAHGPDTAEIRLAFDVRHKLQQPQVAGLFRRRADHVKRIVGERAVIREELIALGLVDEEGLNLTSLGRRVLALIDAEKPL